MTRPGITDATLQKAGVKLTDYPEPGSIEIPVFRCDRATDRVQPVAIAACSTRWEEVSPGTKQRRSRLFSARRPSSVQPADSD